MTLKQALMNGQSIDEYTAVAIIDEMADRVLAGEDPESVLEEEGLEQDYIFDLLESCK